MTDKKNIIIVALVFICAILIGGIAGYATAGSKTSVADAVQDEPAPEYPAEEVTEDEGTEADDGVQNDLSDQDVFVEDYVEDPYWVNPTDSDHINLWNDPGGTISNGTVPKGENIIIYEYRGEWGYTVYGSAGGWVNLDYCEEGAAPAGIAGSANPTVWYAESASAKSYHLDPGCELLLQTTHEIKSGSLEYARTHGHADPCNKCAGGK